MTLQDDLMEQKPGYSRDEEKKIVEAVTVLLSRVPNHQLTTKGKTQWVVSIPDVLAPHDIF